MLKEADSDRASEDWLEICKERLEGSRQLSHTEQSHSILSEDRSSDLTRVDLGNI